MPLLLFCGQDCNLRSVVFHHVVDLSLFSHIDALFVIVLILKTHLLWFGLLLAYRPYDRVLMASTYLLLLTHATYVLSHLDICAAAQLCQSAHQGNHTLCDFPLSACV